MQKSTYTMTAIAKLHLEHEKGMLKSHLKTVDVKLVPDSKLDLQAYLDRGSPTQAGAKAMTNCFVQGLISCIHFQHELGWWDKKECLEYIKSELERGFVEKPTLGEGEMEMPEGV
jgi:hypothetical protein